MFDDLISPTYEIALQPRLRTGVVALAAGAMSSLALVAVTTSTAQAAPSPTTVQVSVTTGGFAPGEGGNGGNSGSERRLFSDDARYVVFESSGPVVRGQKQLEWQIVRRDRKLGTTTLISKSSAGVKGNGGSYYPSISADGQVIAFHSYAPNLVAGDTNGQSDIFTHDVRTGITKRASVTSTGGQVSGTTGDNIVGPPSISADGRYVGFTSHAEGLAPDDSAMTNAYLHDRQTGNIEVVSRASSGPVVDVMPSSTVSVSADGNIVTFHSVSADVVPGDGNGDPDIFVRDRSAATTTVVPAGENGSVGYRHAMTPDGGFIVFESSSDNLVADDTNGKYDVFVYDRDLLTTERVSVATGGTQANGVSRHPAISNDGRHIVFISEATNLVGGDTNGQADAFRHDRTTDQTIRVSVAASGAQNPLSSRAPAISGNGQHVSFESHGKTLTNVDTVNWSQVFVRDLVGAWPALHARIAALPGRVDPNATYRVTTRDIRTGPALAIRWAPKGGTKGGVVRQNAVVKNNAFTLRSPKKPGKYLVSVTYADNTVGSRTINVVKPAAKALPGTIKKGQKLKVRTVGLAGGQQISVHFKPRGGTKGKLVKRTAKVNLKGIAAVRTVAARGAYLVIVRAQGVVLRKAVVRIR